MDLSVEAVGRELEKRTTHACDRAAMEYIKTVLTPNGLAGAMKSGEEGPCTVCSSRISSSKLTVPGRASVIRSW